MVLLDFAFLQLLEQVCVIQRFIQKERVVALHMDAQYLRDGGNHVDAALAQLTFLREEADRTDDGVAAVDEREVIRVHAIADIVVEANEVERFFRIDEAFCFKQWQRIFGKRT